MLRNIVRLAQDMMRNENQKENALLRQNIPAVQDEHRHGKPGGDDAHGAAGQ